MIKDAKKLNVSKFFPSDKPGIRYCVPIFQRAYSWKKQQWEKLLTDVWENDEGYFLGTVICIPEACGNKNKQIFTVIDGQQRLISLLLLYAAIHNLMRLHDNSSNQNENTNSHISKWMKSLKKVLVTNLIPFELRIIPEQEGDNRKWFEEVIKNSLYKDTGNEKNLIFKAYDYFRREISKKAEKADGAYFREIAKLKRKIDQVLMVRIEVCTTTDAYILFESLNTRGLPLTISDIIKNQILSQIDKHYKDELALHSTNWRSMIDNLGEDANLQERFFRHYYNAFRFDLQSWYDGIDIGVKNLGRAKLIGFYEKLASQINVKKCIKELAEKSKFYDSLIHPDKCSIKKCKTGLADLDHIGAAPSYQLLMYILSTKHEEIILKKLIDFLVKFFVRRNLTDEPPSRDMDVLFIDQIELLRTEPGNIDKVIENLKKVSASEDKFIDELKGDLYEENRAACRFILCKIEASYYKGDEALPDFWSRIGSRYRFEIEHVFPQGPNIPKIWINMIAGGDEKNAKKLQDDYVHKLGNLTLTAYNKELRNWDFEKKREHKVGTKYSGYKNGLHLNKDLADETTWTVEKIEIRTNTLVEKALSLFKFTE